MSLRNGIALACIAIPAIVEIGVGVVYFTASEVMPYHQQVLGVAWSDLQPGIRTMLVGFMNAYGSTHFVVGVALTILIAIPLRRGDWWARWAILAVGLPVLGATVYLAGRLAFLTGARTPWRASLVLLALFLAGVGLVEAKRTRDTSSEGAR
jgi:hypothetical protein